MGIPKHWLETLSRQAPEVGRNALTQAWATAKRQGTEDDSVTVIALARQVDMSPLKVRQREDADQLAPWVAHVRAQTFQKPERPFESAPLAVAWLKRHGSAQIPRVSPEARALYQQAVEMIGRVAELTRRPVVDAVPFPMPVRASFLEGRTGSSVWLLRDSAPAALVQEVNATAASIGCDPAGLLMHVLADAPLPARRPTAMIRHRFGGVLPGVSAVITLPTAEAVTEPMVRYLTRRLRAQLGLRKRRSVVARDAALLALVDRTPQRDGESKRRYWMRVGAKWNAGPGKSSPIASPYHVERAFIRLRRRLDATSPHADGPQSPR